MSKNKNKIGGIRGIISAQIKPRPLGGSKEKDENTYTGSTVSNVLVRIIFVCTNRKRDEHKSQHLEGKGLSGQQARIALGKCRQHLYASRPSCRRF